MDLLSFFKLNTSDYLLSQSLFLQALGIVYFFAFGSLLREIKGLYSKTGVLPIATYVLRNKPFSVFRLNSSDFFIVSLCFLGVCFSIALALGFFPSSSLLCLLFIYLSFVMVGQIFLSYQWDALLIEISFIAFFFSLSTPPNIFLLIALWVLLFRFIFSSGIVKLISEDKTWLSLTALQYHYETQPLPNRVAWYMHQLPLLFHKISTVLMFAAELGVPFLIFGSQDLKLIAFALIAALQVVLILTGNFSFLNYLTLALCVVLLPNSTYETLSPIIHVQSTTAYPLFVNVFLSIIGIFFIVINILQLIRLFLKINWISAFLHWLSPLHITRPYGLFAVMTTSRPEMIIQGSLDGEHWQPYEFRYKPQNLYHVPKQIAPFHPRLDWQMWFAALHPYQNDIWVNRFLTALLLNSKNVLKLLKYNPFEGCSPRYVRVDLYEYRFCDLKTHQQTGQWWERHLVAIGEPVELKTSMPFPD